MSHFFKECTYNKETREQMWMSVTTDFHDSICSCTTPIAHFLDIIFPEGHQDKDHTIRQIINRDFKACLSGGIEERGFGGEKAATEERDGLKEEKEDPDIEDTELNALLAAVEDAEKR